VFVVARADCILLVAIGEALTRVGLDRLEHVQPRRRRGVAAAHEQVLGDKRLQRGQACARDAFGRLDGGAAGEHGKAREVRLDVVVEEVVAPVDRGAQRLLAEVGVARARAGSREGVVEARGDLRRREQIAAGGRQLHGEWQAVHAPADVGDDGGVGVVEDEDGIAGTCALAKQSDGVDST
jgi:hypothetical protein